jgi:hypothetical protein
MLLPVSSTSGQHTSPRLDRSALRYLTLLARRPAALRRASRCVMGGLVLFSCALQLEGCTQRVPSERTVLADGHTLRQVAARSDTTVLLVLDPADCTSCSLPIAEWTDWALRHPNRFGLVLSRAPTPVEARQLALMHVAPQGVLRNRWWDLRSRPTTPLEMLFTNGHLVMVAHPSLFQPLTLIQRLVMGNSTEASIRETGVNAGAPPVVGRLR